MSRLGIDTQTVFGMPPAAHVALAAAHGCGAVSIGLTNVPWKLDDFPVWSLRDDAALRRETQAVLRDTGVTLALGEGFAIRAGGDVQTMARDLDLLAELGTQRISTVGIEHDRPRVLDQIAALAELAAARGMRLLVEFAPPHVIDGLALALAAARYAGHGTGVVIDSMHFFRSGGTIAQLADAAAGEIAYCQLSDVALTPPHPDYMQEACFERRCPGDGELPLHALLAALPRDIPVAVEVPNRATAPDAAALDRFVARAVQASARLLPAD